MRSRRPLAALLVALAALVTAALASATVAGGPDPRTLVLTRDDLPTGYGVVERRYQSNARQAREDGVTVARMNASGRVTGYLVTFRRDEALAVLADPAYQVSGSVAVYRTSVQAAAAMRTVAQGAGQQPGIRRLSLDRRIGDETLLYAVSAPGQSSRLVSLYLVVWRHGRLLANVVTVGIATTARPQAAVRLAARQQARMKGG